MGRMLRLGRASWHVTREGRTLHRPFSISNTRQAKPGPGWFSPIYATKTIWAPTNQASLTCDGYWGREWKTDWEQFRPQSTKRPQTGNLSSIYLINFNLVIFLPFCAFIWSLWQTPEKPNRSLLHRQAALFPQLLQLLRCNPINSSSDGSLRLQIFLLFVCCWLYLWSLLVFMAPYGFVFNKSAKGSVQIIKMEI